MMDFAKIAQTDVSKHTEKKGKFSYLSWPYAVAEFRKACPSGTWEIKHFDGKPYCQTDAGHFVEVTVMPEVPGIGFTQVHPVLNNNNKPIPSPTSFDINTSIQRCLVKAIALATGIGLYIYAGEDLPPGEDETGEYITEDQYTVINDLIKETNSDLKKFLKFIGAESLDTIPASKYQTAVAALESKKK